MQRIWMYISGTPHEYIGCFKDKMMRAMPHLASQTDSLTIQTCVKTCLKAGYTYAGAEVSFFLISHVVFQ